MNEKEIISGSGDSTCIVWDLEKCKPKTTLSHQQTSYGDILDISISPMNPNIVALACNNAQVWIWDIRTPRPVRSFDKHESDVNCVSFFPNGMALSSGGGF